jgi:phage-related protein
VVNLLANIDLGTLRATIKIEGADKAKKDLQDVGTETKNVEEETKKGTSASSNFWTNFKSTLAALKVNEIINKIGEAIKNTVSAMVDGVKQLMSAATESYASYEQLQGGAQLMFGEGYDYIAQQAETAAGRIQMSTNDYLTQVNGMAVGLTTALGGNAQAAAQLADKVVTAEADVVAATGQSTEAVQNAFNGVMRGNYTLLDNLGLGIKGTKEGMQEVIDQMNKWNAENGKATQYTIDNVADCQAALTDYVAYVGMAGYASNEGATTIEGATATMKASWENLLTSIGRSDANFNNIITQLSNSAQNYLNVMMEFADTAITNIANSLPQVLDAAISLLENNFPKITQLVTKVITEIGPKIMEALPQLLSAVSNIFAQLWNTIQQLTAGIDFIAIMNDIVTKAIEGLVAVIGGIVDWLGTQGPTIMSAAGSLFGNLATGLLQAIPQVLSVLPSLISTLVSLVSQALDGITQWVSSIDLVSILGDIGAKVGELLPSIALGLQTLVGDVINWLITNGGTLLAAAGSFFGNLIQGLLSNIPNIISGLVTTVQSILSTLMTEGPNLLMGAIDFFLNILTGILNALPDILAGLVDLVTQLISYVVEHGPEMLTSALNFFGQILQGIISKGPEILAKIGSVISDCVSKVGAAVGRMLQKGIELIGGILSGIGQKAGELWSWFSSLPGQIVSTIGDLGSTLWSAGSDLIQGFINGITNAASGIWNSVSGAIGGAVDQVKSFLGIASPSKLFKQFGEWTMEGYEIGVNANADSVADTMADVSKQFTDAFKVEPTIPDFTTPIEEMMSSYANFANRYRVVNGGRAAAPQETNITVNNYSPKALTEVETARQFKRSARALALQNISVA